VRGELPRESFEGEGVGGCVIPLRTESERFRGWQEEMGTSRKRGGRGRARVVKAWFLCIAGTGQSVLKGEGGP